MKIACCQAINSNGGKINILNIDKNTEFNISQLWDDLEKCIVIGKKPFELD